VVGNTVDAPNKAFVVNLSAPLNATIGVGQATGMIIDDDTSTQTLTTVADFSGGTLDPALHLRNHGWRDHPGTWDRYRVLGTALPAGWLSTALITKASAVVSNGSIKLQGTQITSTFPLVGVNRSLEFRRPSAVRRSNSGAAAGSVQHQGDRLDRRSMPGHSTA
jgi:hypothetical protein